MLVTRTPLRITLGGGGTDLIDGEGYCIAAAIDKYVTIAVNNPFTADYLLKYSEVERVKTVGEIRHSLIRRILTFTDTEPGIEISTMADLPSGTGLGSSGAFAVGLLHALQPDVTRPALAHAACMADTGQQDQWAAVYGGVHAFDFANKTLRPIDTHIDDHLQLFYTGVGRVAEPVPVDPVRARVQADAALAALEGDDPELLGACLSEQWALKLETQPSDFHRAMDRVIGAAMELGAYGGKLVGAGAGGFILTAGKVDPIDMRRMGLVEVPFRFAREGSTVL